MREEKVTFTREMILSVVGQIRTPFLTAESPVVYVVYERGHGSKGYGLIAPACVRPTELPTPPEEDRSIEELLLDLDLPDPGVDN